MYLKLLFEASLIRVVPEVSVISDREMWKDAETPALLPRSPGIMENGIDECKIESQGNRGKRSVRENCLEEVSSKDFPQESRAGSYIIQGLCTENLKPWPMDLGSGLCSRNPGSKSPFHSRYVPPHLVLLLPSSSSPACAGKGRMHLDWPPVSPPHTLMRDMEANWNPSQPEHPTETKVLHRRARSSPARGIRFQVPGS